MPKVTREQLEDIRKGMAYSLQGMDLQYADLRGANLSYTNMYRANLRGADLSGADLSGADLRGTNLDLSKGLAWARTGPIGQGRRTLSAYWIGEEVVLQAGCFYGGYDEFVLICEDGGWDWPATQQERLAEECIAAADDVVSRLKLGIAALGGA